MRTPKLTPGQTVGRYTLHERVISFPSEGGKRVVMWSVTCSCSPMVERYVSENSLRRKGPGQSRSCGCLQRERLALPGVQAALRLYFRQYQAQARRAGRVWELTWERFVEIVTADCAYCNQRKTRRIGRKRIGTQEYMHTSLLVSGIDRVDNDLDYLMTPGQCVPCHTRCNSSKGNKTVDQWAEARTAKIEKLIDELVRDGVTVRAFVPAEG